MTAAARRLGLLATLLLLSASLTACLGVQGSAGPPPEDTGVIAEQPTAELAPPTEAAPAESPVAVVADTTYSTGVKPILEASCVKCHGAESPKAGVSLVDYASLMAGGEEGPIVVAGDGAGSKLVQIVTEGKMPPKGDKLTPEQINTISDWIDAGALDN